METAIEFRYVKNPESDEPIMRLDKHIGWDDVDGMGIDGAAFSNELYELAKTKKRIKVYICSVGGQVIPAMQIYNAILDAPCKVDTYNIGVAASSAACIMQAGRKRFAYDYAMFMIHQVQGSSGSAESAFNKSVASMLSRKINKEETDVENLMKRTTYLSAQECKDAGFCDEVLKSSEKNAPKIAEYDNAKAMWLATRNSFNDEPLNKKQMKKVTNKLGLDEAANEESILNGIQAIENRANTAEQKVGDLKKDLETANNKAADFETKFKASEQKLTDIANAAKVASEAIVAGEAKTKVEAAAVAGKISNTDEVKNVWIEKYKADPTGTDIQLGSLAVNKSSKMDLTKDINNISSLSGKAGSFAAQEAIKIEAKMRIEGQ